MDAFPRLQLRDDRFKDYSMMFAKNPYSISDQDFDKLYPEDIQNVSQIHWSSIKAIKTAIDFFSATLKPGAKILDVGSGAGKFCIFGSLISEFNFTGVEKRKRLFNISNKISSKMKNNNISFVCNDALHLDWNTFDGIYLYNPFYEYKMPLNTGFHIDNEIEFSEEKYEFYTKKIYKKLRLLKPGSIVVVYNGYGGGFPKGYIEKFYKKIDELEMSLWKRI